MSFVSRSGQKWIVTTPAIKTAGCNEKGHHETCRTRYDTPDHGATCLGAKEDHLIDRQAAGTHPGGEEELHRGIHARENGDPGEPCWYEHDQDHYGVRYQYKHDKCRRVDEAGSKQHEVARQPCADAWKRECASNGTNPKRAEQQPIAVRTQPESLSRDQRQQRPQCAGRYEKQRGTDQDAADNRGVANVTPSSP